MAVNLAEKYKGKIEEALDEKHRRKVVRYKKFPRLCKVLKLYKYEYYWHYNDNGTTIKLNDVHLPH